MGLDMYLYRCGHLSKEMLNEMEGKRNDTINVNSVVIREKDAADKAMYGDLLPYMDEVNVQFEYFDYEKLKKDFNIPLKADVIGMVLNNKEGIFSFSTGHKITISRDDYDNKYTYYRLEKAYACSCEEVAYWRKHYDLSDEFREHHDVENCGYYMTSYGELEDMDKLFECFPDGIPVVRESQNEGIFYHEWY